MNTLRKIISEHIRYRKTILKLAKSDLIKKYKGTALGWSWALIQPSITLAVYYFAFTFGLRVSRPIEGYPYFLWLIAGCVPWFYMRNIITAGAGSIRKYRFLVTKIKYPISTIPTFVNLSNMFVNIALIFIVMVIFLIFGKMPDIYWLQIPFYLCVTFLFFSLWSLLSGMLATFSRDFMQLINSSTIMLFWVSGIMYDVSSIHSELIRKIMLVNPITILVSGFRDCFIYKRWFWENTDEMFIFSIVFAILLVLTVVAYKKFEREIIDIL